MRRAARVDANQSSIVELLRSIGCLVQDLSAVGHGSPDLLVWHPRTGLFLVEVKAGDQPLSRQSLTAAERAFHLAWSSAPLYIVNSDASAMAAFEDSERCNTPTVQSVASTHWECH